MTTATGTHWGTFRERLTECWVIFWLTGIWCNHLFVWTCILCNHLFVCGSYGVSLCFAPYTSPRGKRWITLAEHKQYNSYETCDITAHIVSNSPDSKVHWANTGSTWVLSAPDGAHVGPMNLSIRVVTSSFEMVKLLADDNVMTWPRFPTIDLLNGKSIGHRGFPFTILPWSTFPTLIWTLFWSVSFISYSENFVFVYLFW